MCSAEWATPRTSPGPRSRRGHGDRSDGHPCDRGWRRRSLDRTSLPSAHEDESSAVQARCRPRISSDSGGVATRAIQIRNTSLMGRRRSPAVLPSRSLATSLRKVRFPACPCRLRRRDAVERYLSATFPRNASSMILRRLRSAWLAKGRASRSGLDQIVLARLRSACSASACRQSSQATMATRGLARDPAVPRKPPIVTTPIEQDESTATSARGVSASLIAARG